MSEEQDPWRWPSDPAAQVAMRDNMRDFNGWEALALEQAITFEGDMGRASVFYGYESCWALDHGGAEDPPEDGGYD